MKTTAILALLALIIVPASATVTIDYVTVGNAGNAADPLTGYGSVSYAYNIGQYEVTNAQYTEFLNAADPTGANPNGIYNASMGSDARGGISYNAGAGAGSKYSIKANMGNKPVNYVSWYDAARFTNWVNNGQGNASTEIGTYTLSGNTGIITKNSGSSVTVWLPSEHEWYKAAYYDPTTGAGGGDNYWQYPTQSNSPPTVGTVNITGDITNPGANVANYNNGADWNSLNGNVSTIGSSMADNYFGTADQGGNVAEWNDAVISVSSRGFRGGSWNSFDFDSMNSLARVSITPSFETDSLGFRLASVPEPSSLVLSLLASACLIIRRSRRDLA